MGLMIYFWGHKTPLYLTNGICIMPTRYVGPIMGMQLLGVQAKFDTKIQVIGP